jgi:hypothetical protein
LLRKPKLLADWVHHGSIVLADCPRLARFVFPHPGVELKVHLEYQPSASQANNPFGVGAHLTRAEIHEERP